MSKYSLKKKNKFLNILSLLPIILPALLISILGLTALLSTTVDTTGTVTFAGIFAKQIVFILVGLLFFLLLTKFNYTYLKYLQFSGAFYLVTIILLILTLLFGPTIKASKRWLPIAGFQIQASELAKISIIILTASIMSFKDKYNEWLLAGLSFIPTLLMVFLIYIQPHGSMALIILILWGLVVFTSLSHQLRNGLIVVAVLIISFSLLKFNYKFNWGVIERLPLYNHQKERIENFFSDDADTEDVGFNVDQAKVAIGSGQLLGKGFGAGTQSKLNFLPEHQTDFLFASFAEEFGFLGTLFLLSIYGFLIFFVFFCGVTHPDPFGGILIIGLGLKILLELFINIGTNTGVIPPTGIPLPLFSAGGSVTVATFISLGLVEAVREVKNTDF